MTLTSNAIEVRALLQNESSVTHIGGKTEEPPTTMHLQRYRKKTKQAKESTQMTMAFGLRLSQIQNETVLLGRKGAEKEAASVQGLSEQEQLPWGRVDVLVDIGLLLLHKV